MRSLQHRSVRLAAVASAWIVLLVATSVAVGPAAGQVQGVSLTLTAPQTDAEGVTPGGEVAYTLTLTNEGTLAGTVSLDAQGGADGWTVRLSPRTLVLPAGGTGAVSLTVTSPPDHDAASALAVTVLADLADATGQFTDSASQTFTTSLAPPAPAPRPFPWVAASTSALLVVVAVAAGIRVLAIRRREGGIEAVASPMHTARPGYDGFVPVRVRNVSDRPRVVALSVTDAPAGWAAGVTVSKLPLGPGEEASVWVAVRPPMDAHGTEVTVRLVARPVEAKRAAPGIAVRIVAAVGGPVPPRPGQELLAPLHIDPPHLLRDRVLAPSRTPVPQDTGT